MSAYLMPMKLHEITIETGLRALTMQDSIIESKTIYYTLFMVFCWCDNIFIEERERKKQDSKSYLDSKSTIFKVINSFRLYNRVCIVSALISQQEITGADLWWHIAHKLLLLYNPSVPKYLSLLIYVPVSLTKFVENISNICISK
jgi:hypothetical protein